MREGASMPQAVRLHNALGKSLWRRSGNRTNCRSGALFVEIFSRSRECYGGLRIVPIPHRPAEVRWIGIAERGTSPRHRRAKSHIPDNLRNVRRAAYVVFALWLAA